MGVAMSFAFIQSLLLLIGWLFGNIFVGVVGKLAHVIGFLLLLYVGGSMLIEGLKSLKTGECEVRDLNGLKNVIIGGIATSIDALAVGAGQSMAGQDWKGFLPLLVAVFVITALSVVCGIWNGKTLGSKFGHWAEICGGAVLIFIGTLLLF